MIPTEEIKREFWQRLAWAGTVEEVNLCCEKWEELFPNEPFPGFSPESVANRNEWREYLKTHTPREMFDYLFYRDTKTKREIMNDNPITPESADILLEAEKLSKRTLPKPCAMKILKKSDFNGMSCWPLREDCHWDDFCILDLAHEEYVHMVLMERFSKLEKSINEAIANGAKRVGISYVNIRDQDRNILGNIGSVVAIAYDE